jgi:hypothetical protein
MNLRETLTRWWCDWTHGGGVIRRDEQGRINWQCGRCGRWSPNPVPLDDEYQLGLEEALRRDAERPR